MKNVYTCILIAIFGIGLLMMGCGGSPTYYPDAGDGDSETTITIDWSDWDTDETSFGVLKSTDPTVDWASLTPVSTESGTSYVDTAVTAGTVYFYAIKAGDEISGFDGGFTGQKENTGPTAVSTGTLSDWYAAVTNIGAEYAAVHGEALGSIDCSGGGTYTQSLEPVGDFILIVADYAGCIDTLTTKQLHGQMDIWVDASGGPTDGSGYIRGLVQFAGEGYTVTFITFLGEDDTIDPTGTFVSDGSWTDTQWIDLPE